MENIHNPTTGLVPDCFQNGKKAETCGPTYISDVGVCILPDRKD